MQAFAKLQILVSILATFPSILCFQLPINLEKYQSCTIYAVRIDPETVNSKHLLATNLLINQTIQQNGANPKLTWIITDHTAPMSTISSLDEIRIQYQKALTTSSYAISPHSKSLAGNSCTVILTDVSQVTMESIVYADLHEAWQIWLRISANGRRLPLGSSSNAILTFTTNPSWKLPRPQLHNTIMVPSAIMFTLTLNFDTFSVEKVQWCCYQCDSEREKLEVDNPFTETFTKLLYKNFPTQLFPKGSPTLSRLSFRPRVNWRSFLSKPLINIDLPSVPHLSQEDRLYCKYSKDTFRKIHGGVKGNTKDCVHTDTFLSTILADFLNYTAVFGNGMLNPWPRVYFKTIIAWTPVNEFLLQTLHFEGQNFGYNDVMQTSLDYCEDESSTKIPGIIKILLEPFEPYIWIASGVTSLVFAGYLVIENRIKITIIGMKAMKKRTISKILFDVYAIIIQNEASKTISVTVIFLSACALLKFIYTGIMAGEMIVPPSIHIHSTLTELFSKHYKLASPPINIHMETYPNVTFALRQTRGMYLENALNSEGFQGDIYSEKYWTEPLRERDFTNYLDFNKATMELRVTSKVVSCNVIPSLRGTQAGLNLIQKGKKKRCHRAKKTYNGQVDFVWVEYSIISREILRVLNSLMYDSGIRYFWNGILHHYDVLVRNHQGTHALVEAMAMDDRLLTIIKSTAALWGVGLVVFLWEIRGKRRDILKHLASIILKLFGTCGERKLENGYEGKVGKFIMVQPRSEH
ncbi:unnamed protein product [Orchesella dallaii]|uniref:Uncharacterized protein n=1 Tax=Orchesella dallaii TaxID=48710 RepID=A0ABP1RJD3_9HEXA